MSTSVRQLNADPDEHVANMYRLNALAISICLWRRAHPKGFQWQDQDCRHLLHRHMESHGEVAAVGQGKSDRNFQLLAG